MTYSKKKSLGELGQFLSVVMLKSKGHNILAENYKVKTGEIDIISLKNNTIYFVESKLSTSTQSSVIKQWRKGQYSRLKKAAAHYLLANAKYHNYNYQVLIIHYDFSKPIVVDFKSYLVG